MKFLFASDSFKGSLTSEQTIQLLTKAVNKVFPDCDCHGIPIADGGMGCMAALGARFISKSGKELHGFGRELADVAHIDISHLDERLKECKITVMCDVKNPLCGKHGATHTFAKQKGASPEIIQQLEKGMCNYRDVILKEFGIDCDTVEGAGAAGGLGAALNVFLNGKMQSGIETVLQLINFDEKLKDVDLVITGEGCTDSQSIYGKVMYGVGTHARKFGISCIGLSGSLGDDAEKILDYGIDSLHCTIDRPMSLDEAMTNAEKLYYNAALRMFRTIKIGTKIKGEKSLSLL